MDDKKRFVLIMAAIVLQIALLADIAIQLRLINFQQAPLDLSAIAAK